MKCPKCQFDNPEDMKFCGECGAKIERICDKCGFANPPTFKFCGKCGQNLIDTSELAPKGLSFDEKLEKIQRYLPKGLTEKILSQRDKIEGEHKQVTVMFCDMAGFTPMVEKLGPEEAYTIMDQVYEILIHKVHDYEGTVNEMTGDGIMALFGAPIALEDAPQRAIRSALSIHREMVKFNEKIKEEKTEIPTLKMRIGIHTGPVVVGTMGNDLQVEFKAVGDTVNLASRMEGLAEPGTTYVTDGTFKLTEGFFRFEGLGEKRIKGKEDPLLVYRVIAPSKRRTQFDVSTERGLTPLVGRQRELEFLIDAYERSKRGRGQALAIISDAGIGKSRLLYEFRKAITNEDATFLEGKCLSYSRNVAYHPVVDLLKGNFDIQDADTEQQIREKVTKSLQYMKIDEASALPYLLELLSVKESGIAKIPLSPEARKERTIGILKRIVLKGAEFRPLVMAVEDLHWMDKSSEDVFKELLESISAARIFLIFTYRTGFIHTWGNRSYHSQVTLNRLYNRESLAMAAHVLGSPSIDADLEELILQKTEGIPFFIEEFVKSLKGLKIIERRDETYRLSSEVDKLSVPSTIQNIIMARVDALPEEAKEVIRTGSVIEREFNYDLIKSISRLPEKELLSHLSAIKDSELLYERGIYPESTYIFKHALTREVIYDSLLTKKKQQIHEKVASVMEETCREDICYHYGILADHFIASQNYEKGADYARLQAKRYQESGSFIDAIEYAKKSVSNWEKLPQTEMNQKKRIDARTTLARYYMNMSLHSHAKEAVEPILDLASALNYRKRLPAIYTIIANYCFWVEEDGPQGLSFIDKATSIAQEVGDYLSLWLAHFQAGIFLTFISEFNKSLDRLQKCLELIQLTNNPMGLAFSKGAMSQLYQTQGKMDIGYKLAREVLTIAKETDDAFIKGMAYSFYGSACYLKGSFDKAKNHLSEWVRSYERFTSTAWKIWAYAYLGCLYTDLTEYDEALRCYEKIANVIESTSILPSQIGYFRSCLIKSKVLRHDHDIELSELFSCYQNFKLTWGKGWTARNIGEILLNLGDAHLSDAAVWFQRAIENDIRNGFMWVAAGDHASYAEWFKRTDDIKGAKEQIAKAIDGFTKCGANGWVEKYQKELALLK
jgi:class 3 adenylate cyclase/tetratricopeptide (TPR) repeat protein